ncbi:MAG: phosphate ABC transporter, permease protein PstA, partial [Opitutae bacterium]
MFQETQHVKRKKRAERTAQGVFLGMTLCMVLPLIAVVGFLIYKASPVLSIDFIMDAPERGMRAGGIWPAFWGTVCLVFFSVIIAAPVGVLAAVYLHEYAPENWFTRMVNLAVFNLAGVPSIVHALFGLGAFVLFAGLGKSILAASLTLAIMTFPVIIESTKESLAAVPR